MLGDYERLCPGGHGFRPNGVSAVLEGTYVISQSQTAQPYPVAYLRGGGCATAPPLWFDRKFFWLILHCFVGFISRLNRMKSVSRGMDVCIIVCYYTDVHARPEASSDMSVFTITAGWLPLANFNRWTVASAVHRD